MKARAAAFASVVAIAAAAACADVPETPTPVTVVNACNSNEDCPTASGAQCVRTVGACLLCDPATGKCGTSIAALDVIYVISFPTTSTQATLHGNTVAVTRRDLSACIDSSCSTPGACNCMDLQGMNFWVLDATGTYIVDNDIAKAVGLPLPAPSTLPTRTIFRALSPFALRNVADKELTTLASSVLMPLDSIVADVSVNPAGNEGPFGTDTLEFRAAVPRGAYMRVMQPLPPFEQNFPPAIGRVNVGGEVTLGAEVSKVVPRPFTLQTTQDLTGWQTFMRDRRIGERITNLVTFNAPPAANGYDVKLFTVGYGDLSKEAVEIVVRPPEEKDATPALVKDAQAQFVNNQKIPFPTLVASERVSGFVLGNPEGVPIAATLLFQSVVDSGGNSRLEPVNTDLRYTRQAATDSEGRFSVFLPPGQYDVAIAPGLDTGFATTVGHLNVAKGGGGDGRGLGAARLGTLQGFVRIGSTNPLGGATVRAIPSLEDAVTAVDQPFPALARPRETKTADDGSFLLSVDPGVYDVVVEPPKGSRYGVKRLFGVRVGDGADPASAPKSVHVAPIEIGPPLDLGFSLVDRFARAPISGAVVRAFAIPPGKTLPVELAWGVTDRKGRVDLYVSVPTQGTTL